MFVMLEISQVIEQSNNIVMKYGTLTNVKTQNKFKNINII